jgi:hypothetical protein
MTTTSIGAAVWRRLLGGLALSAALAFAFATAGGQALRICATAVGCVHLWEKPLGPDPVQDAAPLPALGLVFVLVAFALAALLGGSRWRALTAPAAFLAVALIFPLVDFERLDPTSTLAAALCAGSAAAWPAPSTDARWLRLLGIVAIVASCRELEPVAVGLLPLLVVIPAIVLALDAVALAWGRLFPSARSAACLATGGAALGLAAFAMADYERAQLPQLTDRHLVVPLDLLGVVLFALGVLRIARRGRPGLVAAIAGVLAVGATQASAAPALSTLHTRGGWIDRFVADSRTGWGTWSLDLATGRRRRISSADNFADGVAAGSNGRIALAGMGSDSTIATGYDPAWRPRSSDLAYIEDGRLRDARRLLPRFGGGVSGPLVWSPDGRRLALRVDGDGGGIAVVTVGQHAVQHIPLRWTPESPLAWTPDGRSLAFFGRNGSAARGIDPAHLAAGDGSRLLVLTLGRHPHVRDVGPGLSGRQWFLPGGRELVARCWDGDLCISDLQGHVRKLTHGQSFGRDLALSPDGRVVAATRLAERSPSWVRGHSFMGIERSDLVLVRVADGRIRRISSAVRWPAQPVFSVDGTHLIYSCCQSATFSLSNP